MNPDFTFAHVGLNIRHFDEIVSWYVKNLACTVVRKPGDKVAFLADPSGRVIIEFYDNPEAPVLPFQDTHFLTLHLAFLVEDPKSVSERLVKEGAVVYDPYKITPAGDQMVMLQDPWGIAVQLIKRAEAMF